MSGKQSKRMRRLAGRAAQDALEQIPGWTFVAKIVRPKPRWVPFSLWRRMLRWLFPGTTTT